MSGVRLYLAAVALLASFIGFPRVAAAQSQDTLQANAGLRPGQQLVSQDGRFRAVYQGDGNFVVYGPDNKPTWASNTAGRPGTQLVMQTDGNLVIYRDSAPLWSSQTNGRGPGRLVMQNDGNLVIYAQSGPVWASRGMAQAPIPTRAGAKPAARSGLVPVVTAQLQDTLQTNGVLRPGQQLVSQDGRFRAVYQGDGNFVVYGPDNNATWASNTVGQQGTQLVMQSDGNLVIYRDSSPLWASQTSGRGPGRLVMQNDGNLVIYAQNGPVWASKGIAQPPACVPANVRFDEAAIEKRERCFGALGNGCKTQHLEPTILGVKLPLRPVNSDCTINVSVSVGSILHDNCCLTLKDRGQQAQGHMCTGADAFQTIADSVPNANDLKPCSREWRKASFDVLENRHWLETFGPYFSHQDQDRLEAVGNPRQTMTAGRGGVTDDPMPSTTGERVETRRLAAPSGTKLEYFDVQFCRSGRFREEQWCRLGDCVTPKQLQEARDAVTQWEQWAAGKEREARKYQDTDPRAIAPRGEVVLASADYQLKKASLTRRQQIHDNRTSHFGFCE